MDLSDEFRLSLLHDINILVAFALLENIVRGTMMRDFKYTVRGRQSYVLYNNADGIYPNWHIFVKKLPRR